MVTEKTRLEALTTDDLAKVVNLYPWYGAARKELCQRMAAMTGSDWGILEYSDAALYIPSRGMVADIIRSGRSADYSDKDVEALLKRYIAPEPQRTIQENPTEATTEPAVPYRRTVRIAGGDFFSQEEYDQVRTAEDNVFSRFTAERTDNAREREWHDPELGFCTETLAGIYAEQGYPAEARKIYSHLMLRYPEKSAYFAALIEKLQTE